MRSFTIITVLLSVASVPLRAQELIGYVSTKDADVSGASDIMDGHAVLSGSVAVTAKDHTAPITLGRGGAVRVCQTSVLHLTESKAATIAAPLLFSLDRGAVEIQMSANDHDAIMTPDLRFAVRFAGPLDLRLRVARNGDTCVENRGPQAPILTISDPFGDAVYELLPNQHVLFEHGSLREVVDHETTPCGCPDSPGMSIADALLAPGSGSKSTTSAPADTQHPFPAAVSEGLAPETEVPAVPQALPGQVHTQIADTLSYSAQPPTAAPSTTPTPPPAEQTTAPPEPKHDLAHAIGHFFQKLFGHS